MRKNYVKGLAAGVLALSMVIGASAPALAYQAEEGGAAVIMEAKAKKSNETNKPGNTNKPGDTKNTGKAKTQEVGKVTCTASLLCDPSTLHMFFFNFTHIPDKLLYI